MRICHTGLGEQSNAKIKLRLGLNLQSLRAYAKIRFRTEPVSINPYDFEDGLSCLGKVAAELRDKSRERECMYMRCVCVCEAYTPHFILRFYANWCLAVFLSYPTVFYTFIILVLYVAPVITYCN